MGQKVHPYGFRVGFNKPWLSRWYAEKEYANLLHEDLRIRKFIAKRLAHAGISRVDIERTAQRVRVTIFTARPGIIIGRKGVEVERLKKALSEMTDRQVHINIQEVKQPELDPPSWSPKRHRPVSSKRRVNHPPCDEKSAVTSAVMRLGAEGIKIAWWPDD